MAVSTVKLNTGYEMPVLGFGTWNSAKGDVEPAIRKAIDVGYRHIDMAWVYGNEKEIGETLQEKYKEGKVKRSDLFLTSKLWNNFHDPKDVKPAFMETLKFLKTDYLDLYLMHWPFAFAKEKEILPREENGEFKVADVHYVDTWKAMEKLQKEGLVRSIGISNFNAYQIKKIMKEGSIVPAVHQIECHPYLNEEEHVKFCRQNGIMVTAYAPLGSPKRPWGQPGEPLILDDPVLKIIAEKHGKSAAQVAIRFQIQRGNIVIPKSVTPSRIESNFQVFDFQLSDEDMKAVYGINRDWRALVFDKAAYNVKYWAYRPNYTEE